MKVLDRAVTPQGERLTLEDWSEDYPGLHRKYGVAWFHAASESGDWMIRRGETWRFDYYFHTLEGAAEMFDGMQREDCHERSSDFLWNPELADFI